MAARIFYLYVILLTSVCNASTADSRLNSHEDLKQLQRQAHEYLYKHYTTETSEITLNENGKDKRQPRSRPGQWLNITVNRLDPRLKLSACLKPLSFKLKDHGSTGGHVSIKASCHSQKSWSIYMTATVDILTPVAVTQYSLKRGAILKAEDIAIKPLSQLSIGNGFSKSAHYLVGKQLKRPLNAGEVIRLSHLKTPLAIKRGDTVTIEANAASIMVVTQGEALTQGNIGDQIRVSNTRSGRTLKARVVAPGRVRIVL